MTDQTTTDLPEDFGRSFVTLVRRTLMGAADALGDLDRRAGDGDFGTNVRTAMKGVERTIQQDTPRTYREWLTALFMGWLGVGGTSGPLFGMFFRDLAKAAEHAGDGVDAAGREGAVGGDGAGAAGGGGAARGDGAAGAAEGEAAPGRRDAAGDEPVVADRRTAEREAAAGGRGAPGDAAAPSLEAIADALAAGQATVQRYGKARVGDKTMIDALDPAIAALRSSIEAGRPAAEALAAAERAAVEGARSTAETTARRGRASYVGDAAKGVIDPGAAAMALVIGALRAAAAGEQDVAVDWID